MLDFTLTEEQRNIRDLAHDFAEKEIRPVAWEYDRDATWPQEIIEKAWELGLMNPQLPEQYGGTGASYLDGVLIGEELAWGCAAIATTLGINELAAAPVLLGGSERIKARYLAMLSEEPRLASFCLTEPEAGSDVSSMRTTTVRRGDKYVINGSKVFISNGGYADSYTVYAKTDRDAGHRGIFHPHADAPTPSSDRGEAADDGTVGDVGEQGGDRAAAAVVEQQEAWRFE